MYFKKHLRHFTFCFVIVLKHLVWFLWYAWNTIKFLGNMWNLLENLPCFTYIKGIRPNLSILLCNYVSLLKMFFHFISQNLSQYFTLCLEMFGTSVAFKCLNGFDCWAVGDPQFWQDLRPCTDPEHRSEFFETVLIPSDSLNITPCKRKADAHDSAEMKG